MRRSGDFYLRRSPTWRNGVRRPLETVKIAQLGTRRSFHSSTDR